MTQTDGCEETEAEKGKQMMYLSLPCIYHLYFVSRNPLDLPPSVWSVMPFQGAPLSSVPEHR